MEEIKTEDTCRDGFNGLAIYDPDRLPYETLHLCVYLGELEEPGEREPSGPGTP
jgi:hypothetical protein